MCHLEDGGHFGEISLVLAESSRIATVVAVEECELYRLQRSDFRKAIAPYPDLMDKMLNIAFDRKETVTQFSELHKRETELKKKLMEREKGKLRLG